MAIYSDTGNNTEANRYATVRRMAGSLDQLSMPDDELEQIITRADRWVEGMTQKTGWLESDPKWYLVILASNQRAAAECLDTIPTREANDQARMKRTDARESIKLINEKEEIQSTFHMASSGPNIADHTDRYKYTHRPSSGDYIGTV